MEGLVIQTVRRQVITCDSMELVALVALNGFHIVYLNTVSHKYLARRNYGSDDPMCPWCRAGGGGGYFLKSGVWCSLLISF